MTLCLTFLYFLGPIFNLYVLKKVFPGYMIDESILKIETPIDNYWQALDDQDHKWTVMEESNSRSLLSGIPIMTDESFNRLKNARTTKGN